MMDVTGDVAVSGLLLPPRSGSFRAMNLYARSIRKLYQIRWVVRLIIESQSTSFSSHCLRINAVVFLVRSEKSDHQNAIYVLNQGNQPKIVSFDIENHTTALQDARLRVRFLHLFRRAAASGELCELSASRKTTIPRRKHRWRRMEVQR